MRVFLMICFNYTNFLSVIMSSFNLLTLVNLDQLELKERLSQNYFWIAKNTMFDCDIQVAQQLW